MMDIKEALLLWFKNCLIKNLLQVVVLLLNKINNQLRNCTNQLLEILKNVKYINQLKIKNIWGTDLADRQLLSKFDKGLCFLLCVIDIFNKYTLVFSLKNKKGTAIVNAFQNNSNDSKRKPNKIWTDKCSEFRNRSMKLWLQDNDIEMYSTHFEGKFVVAERFIRNLKAKICK